VLAALLCGVVLAVGQAAWATTSGLNNIPTADVVPHNVLVLQQINNLGSDQQTLQHLGFKYGPAENWEIGLDDRVHASGSGAGVGGAGGLPAGPMVLQFKYRYEVPRSGTSLALGVANLGEDSDEAGDSFPYAVLTRDFRSLRGHLGYGGESAGRGLFLGVDKTLKNGTVVRADWIQTDDRKESLTSVGFMKSIGGPWVVEGWVSFPTADGVEDTFTLKFNYVLDLRS